MRTLITFLDRPAPAAAPYPGQLWAQAAGDTERYHQLLREHGYIVSVAGTSSAPPQQSLPCGWHPDNHRVPIDFGPLIWNIPSDSGNGVYPVRQLPDGRWYCPCADFEYRGHERPCKHVVRAMKLAVAATQSEDGRGKVTV